MSTPVETCSEKSPLSRCGDAAGELDHLEAALHLAERVASALPCSPVRSSGEVHLARGDQLAEGEHDVLTLRERGEPPGLERGAAPSARRDPRLPPSPAHLAGLLARGRVEHLPDPSACPPGELAVNPVLDLPHRANLHGDGRYDRAPHVPSRPQWLGPAPSWVSSRRGQIQERCHWPRPGDRSPWGWGRGYRPGMRKLVIGGGANWHIVLLLLTLLGGGGDLSGLTEVLQPAGGVQPETGNTLDPSVDPETDLAAFLEEVLQDTQGMWVGVFEESGLDYRPTNLVLFNGFTQSECGGAQAQSGPHYCPLDELVYTDLDFLAELQRRFGAAGDTAQAYILAHEVGHHVQHQLGITKRSRAQGPTKRASPWSFRPTALPVSGSPP